MAFDINAQVILSGPKGLDKVRNKIKKDLSRVSVPVKLDFDKGGGKALKDINAQINSLNSSFKRFNSNAQKVSKSIKQAGDASRRSNSNVGSLANTSANLAQTLKKTGGAAKQAGSEIEAFGKDAALAIRRFSAFTLATGAVFGFVRAVQEGISEGIEFERQLTRLRQVSGASKSQLESLDRSIGNLASTLGISQIELAQTAVTLAQTGKSIREVEFALKAISKASLAPTFGDIKSTTEGVIAALAQFRISAKQTEEVLGSLNAISKQFAVESEDLVSVIRRAGGVFSEASRGIGEPIESFNELLGIFTAVRSSTRETADTISTGLRTIFSRLQRKSTIAFLKDFNIDLLDAQGNFEGFFKSFQKISEGLKGLDTLQLGQVVEELGGIRQIGKILPVIKNFDAAVKASNVGLKGAKEGLGKDVALAADTLSVRIAGLSESFSTLIKNVTQSKTFQTFAKTAISVANGFVKTVDALRPLLPLLASLGGIKLVDIGGEFFKGFKDGITKTKDIIDKTEEALDGINKKGGGGSSSGGGGGGGKGPIGPDSKLLDALKGNTTALTSNTQALIRNSNLLDKLTRLGIGSNVAKVSDEKSKKKTADQAIATIPTDPAETLLQNIEETASATKKKSREEFQKAAAKAESKKLPSERRGFEESGVQIPLDAKALAAETTKALKEANRTQALTTSNRNKAKFSGVGASRVGGEAEINAITTQISKIESSNDKLTEALVELQVEFTDEKTGKLTVSAGDAGKFGSAARKIEKLIDRIARNQEKVETLETKRENVAPLDIAAIIAETKSAISEKEKSEAKAKQTSEASFAKADKAAKEKAAQQEATESLRGAGFVGIPNADEGNRPVTGKIIKSIEDANIVVDVDLTTGEKLPPSTLNPDILTNSTLIQTAEGQEALGITNNKRNKRITGEQAGFKNTSTPFGNYRSPRKNKKVIQAKENTFGAKGLNPGLQTIRKNQEEREKLSKQIISDQEEISNSYSDQQAINESTVLQMENAKNEATEIARRLAILNETLPPSSGIIIPDIESDTGAGQNTSESSETRIIGTDASGNIQRERSFDDDTEKDKFESDLRKKQAKNLEEANRKLQANEDSYIKSLGKLYDTDISVAAETARKASAKIESTESPTPNIPIAKVNTVDESVFEGGVAREPLEVVPIESVDYLERVISIKFDENTGKLEKLIEAVGEPIDWEQAGNDLYRDVIQTVGEPTESKVDLKELSDINKKFGEEQQKIYDNIFPDRNVPGLELGEDIDFRKLKDFLDEAEIVIENETVEEGFKRALSIWEETLKEIASGSWVREIEKALAAAANKAQGTGPKEGPPKFAKGGFVKGPSHSQGGVRAELEGGEFVVPKKNVDQKTGLPKFQNGGSFDDLPEIIKDIAETSRKSGQSRIASAVGARFGRGKGSAANQKAVLTDNIIVDNKPEETGALIGPSEKNNTGLIAAEGNVTDRGLDLIRKINPDIVIPEGIKKANLLARGGYGAFGFKETSVDGEGDLTFGGKKGSGRSNAIFDQMKEQINTFSSSLVSNTVPLLNNVLGLTDFFKPISSDSGNVLDEKIIEETFNSLKGAVSESLASVISNSELQGGQESFDLKDLDSAQSARLSTFFESPAGADVTQLKKAEVKANLALARASDGGLVSKVVNEALSDDEFLKRFELFASKDTKDIKGTTPFEILPQDEKSAGGLSSSPNSLLTPGELVFNPRLAQKVGLQNLKKFNRTGDSSLIRGLLGSDASKVATVPGKGNKDTFAATLDRGSFVIKKSSSEKSGLQNFNTGGLFGVQSFQNGGQSSGGAGFDTSFFSELAKNVAKASIAFGSLKSIDFGNIAEVVQVVPILSMGLEGVFDSFSAGADALLSDEDKIIEAKLAAVGEEIASVESAAEATKGLTEAATEASEALTELPDRVTEAVAKARIQSGENPSSLANQSKAAETLEKSVVAEKKEFQGTAEKPDLDESKRREKVKEQRAERNKARQNLSRQERRELIANDPSRRIRKQDAADRANFDKDIAEAQSRADNISPAESKKGKRDLAQLKQNKQQFFNLPEDARLGKKGFNLKDGDTSLGRKRRTKKGLLDFDDLLPKLGGGGKGKGGLKGIFSKLAGKVKSAPKDIASAGVSKIRKGGFKAIPEDLFGDGFRDGIKKLKSKGNFKKISKGFFTDLVDQFKDPKKLKAAFTKGKNIPGIIAAIVANPIVSAIGDKVGLKEIGGAKGFESGSTVSAGAFGAASGAATGAATGAAIGSLIPIPVVGTLVGGIVGAVVGGIDGLFSGIKDQKIFNALSSLDKVAKEAAESIGDLGKVEELDLGTDDGRKKIDKFLSAQEKLSKSVIDTSNKLDDIEGGSSLSRDGIPNATGIGSVLGGPVGTVVGGAIDLAESEAISSAFGSAEESLTSWSQSLEDNSGNKIAQFLQPFVQGTSEAAGSISKFASSLEQGITESDLYKSTIGALSSGVASVTSAFSTAGSVINQQGFFGAASTAAGATLSSSTGGFTDEIKGLFTGQSGQEVRDDRTASVSGALVLEEQTKSVESFITSVNLLDTENLKSAGEALATLGQNSIGALFEIESAASKIAKLVISEGGGASEDFKNIDSLSDLSEQFKSFDKNADQTARVFKNLAANAANLESVNLETAFAGITGEDQDFKNALKPFQVANKKFLETLGEEGKSIEDANDARNKELLKSIQAGIGTKDGLGDLIKGAQIDVLDDKGQVKKDAEGNKITRDAEVDNFDDVQKVISSIFAAGDKADPAKIEALTAAFGGNATEAQNVFNAIVQNTGQEQKRQLEIAKSTLLEKARQQKIKESLKLFDAFGTAVDKLNKGVSSITDKFTTVASNVNSEVEKILAGDTSITAGAKLNPFENIDAASKAEIEQGVNNISGAIGPGGGEALEDITNTLDFGKNLEDSITTLIDNTELKLSSNKVSSADITGQNIVKDFESDPANAAALSKLPEELREQFLQGLSASVESSRQDGGTIGIKELKQSLVSGELTAGIDQFTDQTAAALAEVTNSLNVLNSAVINAANVQSEIAQITTQKELTLLGQREAFEDRFNKFLDKSVNAREQAESRLKKRLETTINAGGAGARGAAAVGIGAGETNVLDAASLTDRRERLQAEREELKQKIGEGAGQEGEVGGALNEGDTDELVKALADNQQALKGTNDALQQLGDDVSILAGIESELASIQESKLSAEQKVFRLNEKLAGAKTPAERKKILDEENKPIAALGKAKRIASGELDGNLTEKDAIELLKLDADPRKKSLLKASNTDEGEFNKLIDQALLTLNENNRAEGLSDVQADARKNDLNEVGKQALLDEADRVQAQKEGAVESQANDKVTALDAQFVLLTGNVKTAKDELALLTQEVIKLRGGEPNLAPNARLGDASSTPSTPSDNPLTNLADSSAFSNLPSLSAQDQAENAEKAASLRSFISTTSPQLGSSATSFQMGETAEAAFMAKGGSDGIATPNVFSDIDTLKPDVNKIAQQNAVNKIFEEQPTQQQFLKETQSERVDRARDKNPLRNRRDSRLGREIPKALEQGGLVLNDSAEKLLQASQALSGENDFADKVSKAADKLSSLPELKVNLDAKVGTIDVVLNGGALMNSFGEKVKNDVLAAVAEKLKGLQTPDGSLSDPRLS